jgi:predicted PurR-regulated permease PerM
LGSADFEVMMDDPVVATEQPTLVEEAQRGRQAWRRLALRLQTVTPRALARLLLVMGGLGAALWLLMRAWQALVPFAVGAILAYAVLPVVDGLDRVMPRRLAALLAMLVVLCLVGLFLATLIPALARQYERLVDFLPDRATVRESLAEFDRSLETWPEPVREAVRDSLDKASVSLREKMDSFSRDLPDIMINALGRLLNIIGAIIGLLVLPIWMLSVLTDQRKGTRAVNRILPQSRQGDFWAVMGIVDRSFRAFFQKQVTQGLLVGIAVFGISLLFKETGLIPVRFPLLMGFLVGMMELVPEIGPTVAALLLGVLGLLISPMAAVYALGSYLLAHHLVGNQIAARIQNDVQELHPAILIVAAIALSQLGLGWLLLSVPITTALRDLFRYVYGRLGDPPRPPGLLPDQPLPTSATAPAARRVPLVYRRHQSAAPGRVIIHGGE